MKNGRFRTTISKDRKQIYLGKFDTPEEASKVYEKKAKELFGEFYYKHGENND